MMKLSILYKNFVSKYLCKVSFIGLALSFIHLALSFVFRKYYFWETYATLKGDIRGHIWLIANICLLISLVLVYQILVYVIKNYKKNSEVKQRTNYFLIYFIYMSLFFLLLYPGTFRWDEFNTIPVIRTYGLLFWQNHINSFFYIVTGLIFPSVISTVVCQYLIMSLFVSDMAYKWKTLFPKSKLILFYIVFLSFPTIYNSLTPIRAGLYAYILAYYMFCLIYDYYKKAKWSTKKIVRDIVLIGFIASIKTEGLLLIPFALIVTLLIYRKTLNFIRIFTFIFGIVFFFMVLQHPTKANQFKNKYSILSLTPSISSGMLQAIEDDTDFAKDYEILYNMQAIERSNKVEIWGDNTAIKEKYSDDEAALFKKTMLKTIITYPDKYIKSCYSKFLSTNSIGKTRYIRHNAYDAFNYTPEHNRYNRINELRNNVLFFNPINNDVRNAVFKIIICDGFKYAFLIWSIIPIGLLAFCLMGYYLFKKNPIPALMLFSIFILIFGIFLTAPSNFFMYYYPSYLVMRLLFCFGIYAEFFSRRRGFEIL